MNLFPATDVVVYYSRGGKVHYNANTHTFEATMTDVEWSSVSYILDRSNIPPDIWAEIERYVADTNIGEPVVFMATHSMGDRDWKIVEGAKPAFFFDGPGSDDGWYLFREGEVTYLFCQSATSGSTLEASLQFDGKWKIKLTVPMDDSGEPYHGVYSRAFHREIASMV